MNRFENKVALITGGGGDIGSACAGRLLDEGCSVVVLDFNKERLDTVLEAFKRNNANIKGVLGDVRSFADNVKAVEYTLAEFGKLDILITCAGIAKHMPIDEMPEEIWKEVIDTNITGVFFSTKATVPEMKKNNYGRIVHISSLGGRTGRPGVGVNYAASKAGVGGLTMLLGYELGPWNITVNSVAPGPLNGRMMGSFPLEMTERLKAGVRINRFGEMSDISAAVAYMASDEAGWTTGEILDVNGGLQY